jgi:hypothetical protein
VKEEVPETIRAYCLANFMRPARRQREMSPQMLAASTRCPNVLESLQWTVARASFLIQVRCEPVPSWRFGR